VSRLARRGLPVGQDGTRGRQCGGGDPTVLDPGKCAPCRHPRLCPQRAHLTPATLIYLKTICSPSSRYLFPASAPFSPSLYPSLPLSLSLSSPLPHIQSLLEGPSEELYPVFTKGKRAQCSIRPPTPVASTAISPRRRLSLSRRRRRPRNARSRGTGLLSRVLRVEIAGLG
jgi:hypothetical protein